MTNDQPALTERKPADALPRLSAAAKDIPASSVIAAQERNCLLAFVEIACLLFLCGVTVADPDLWGHTLYGLRAIEQGVLVERSDPFSYTAPGAPWTNHEWLTERLLAECWRAAGNAGLVAWRNLGVLVVFGVLWRELRRPGVSLAAAWLLLVFNTECLANYTVFVRPQLGTYVGFFATLVLLRTQWDRLSGAIWLVPPLMVVWTNLHGGFLAGVALTGLFTAAAVLRGTIDAQRRGEALTWVAAGLATALATLVNPYGIGLHRMLWGHLVSEQPVLEWQSIWEATPSAVYVVPFLLTFLGLAGSRKWQWIDAVVLVVVGWQAASHIRHIALFSLTTLALLPIPLSDALQRLFPRLTESWSRENRRWWRWTAAGLIAGFLAAIHVSGVSEMWRDGLRPWHVAVETRSGVPGMPVAAVREIQRRGLTGNLLTDYGWGQFALWHLHPRIRVAFDGRYRTVYPPQVEAELMALQRAAENHAAETPLLDHYPTDLALAPAAGSLERYLDQRADWVCIFRDGQAAIFVRQPKLATGSVWDAKVSPGVVPSLPRWAPFPGLESATK